MLNAVIYAITLILGFTGSVFAQPLCYCQVACPAPSKATCLASCACPNKGGAGGGGTGGVSVGGTGGKSGAGGAISGGTGGVSGKGTGGVAGGIIAGSGGAGGAGGAGGTVTGGAGGSNTTPKAPSYYVQGSKIYDACGEQIIMKGVNQLGQYVDERGLSMPEIAKTGANAVRIFWYPARTGVASMETAVKAALANHMVPIIEAHDSTCAWSMTGIQSAWTAATSVSMIKKYQTQIIVNIANEANAPSLSTYLSTYTSIIQAMRTAGIHVPLMIDSASSCGRNYQSLLSQGKALLAADPDHNLIFSAHLYDSMSAATYASVYKQFNDAGLAFMVGEFANRVPPGCGAAIDYKSLIGEAQKAGIGWLAWSWGDNTAGVNWNSDCGEFDMTDTFSYSTIKSGWAMEVLITDPNSVQKSTIIPYSLSHGGQCR